MKPFMDIIETQVSAESQKNTHEAMRVKIMALEQSLLSLPESQRVHLEPKHYFAPGLYLRELSIPMGVTLTGAIHKTEHFCILAKGVVSVGGMGGPAETHTAPTVVRSMPGAKRAIYAHEDSVWINVHHNPTNEQDLEKIWDLYTAKTFEDALAHREQHKLEGGD